MSGDGVVKLADVGASVLSHAGDGEMNPRGTPVCMAPELFQVQQTCLLHCDVDQWVAIVICCPLLFSSLLFSCSSFWKYFCFSMFFFWMNILNYSQYWRIITYWVKASIYLIFIWSSIFLISFFGYHSLILRSCIFFFFSFFYFQLRNIYVYFLHLLACYFISFLINI